jgi:hypothetical protein
VEEKEWTEGKKEGGKYKKFMMLLYRKNAKEEEQ